VIHMGSLLETSYEYIVRGELNILELIISLLRDLAVLPVLVKFETNLEIPIEITGYLVEVL
jgi:hypothetical protein